jgi:arsenate reductase-like glutaredoxin family protein
VSELRALLERAGLRVSEVLSTRSRVYNELNLAEKDLSDQEILELMAARQWLDSTPKESRR